MLNTQDRDLRRKLRFKYLEGQAVGSIVAIFELATMLVAVGFLIETGFDAALLVSAICSLLSLAYRLTYLCYYVGMKFDRQVSISVFRVIHWMTYLATLIFIATDLGRREADVVFICQLVDLGAYIGNRLFAFVLMSPNLPLNRIERRYWEYAKHRQEQQRQEEEQQRQEQLSLLPFSWEVYPTSEPIRDEADEVLECTCCLDLLDSDQLVARTTCRGRYHHFFHEACLSEWFHSQQKMNQPPSCPECRCGEHGAV